MSRASSYGLATTTVGRKITTFFSIRQIFNKKSPKKHLNQIDYTILGQRPKITNVGQRPMCKGDPCGRPIGRSPEISYFS